MTVNLDADLGYEIASAFALVVLHLRERNLAVSFLYHIIKRCFCLEVTH